VADGRPLTYGTYPRVDDLVLAAAFIGPLEHDEPLFVTIHQVYDLTAEDPLPTDLRGAVATINRIRPCRNRTLKPGQVRAAKRSSGGHRSGPTGSGAAAPAHSRSPLRPMERVY